MKRCLIPNPQSPIPLLLGIAMLAAFTPPVHAQDVSAYTHLTWRSIGPFRGGRTVAAVGVPQQPGCVSSAQLTLTYGPCSTSCPVGVS